METVSCEQIANELGVTRRHVLRQIQRRADQLGINVIRGKKNEVFLTRNDADMLIGDYEPRRRSSASSNAIANSGDGFGFVYVIQLLPEELPLRHKLGYTDNLEQRLRDHRTTTPTLKLAKAWPCKRTWEVAAIASMTRSECEKIGVEVYDGETNMFLSRADAFFDLMPMPAADELILE